MGTEPHQLHVAFFPFMAPGHIIPMLDIARLFAARHVKTIILTTPVNASNIKSLLDAHKNDAAYPISIYTIPFPYEQASLPVGVENMDGVTSHDMFIRFILSAEQMREPLEAFLEETRPNGLVADLFFPFSTDVAAKFDVPRLVFNGTSCFAMCAMAVLAKYEPHKAVPSDDELFVLPHLPHEVRLTKSQLSQERLTNSDVLDFFKGAREAQFKSYGEVVNSFYELEPEYADYYRNVLGIKSWHVGPVSLCNRKMEEKSYRGKQSSISEHECVKWLNLKDPDSVIYICFGSMCKFSASQLKEVNLALESSGHPFIWVVRKGKDDQKEELIDDFEKRVEGRGLIIRGWAPQVLILEHQAIGGFVTHCGWNSTLEGISAGVPVVTWPLFAEQFYNEKLLTDVLKIGVQVGSKEWNPVGEGTFVKQEEIEAALNQIMEGIEASEMRSRAKKLRDLAREAVEEGGSSYRDLSSLIHQLCSHSE